MTHAYVYNTRLHNNAATIEYRSSTNNPPPPYSSNNRTSQVLNHAPWVPRDTSPSESERSPLLNSAKKHNVCDPIIYFLSATIVVLLIFGAYFIGLYTKLPAEQEAWERDRLWYQADRELWKSQRQVWEHDRAENERQNEMYKRDLLIWQREREHMSTERALFQADLALQDQERKHWVEERAEHVREKRQWDTQRMQWEREELLHPGRCPVVPVGAYWDEPTPSPQCHSYGKREYSARLRNIPSGWSWVDACNATPMIIHGISLRSPNSCEDLGLWGGLIGHWIVDFEEDACKPTILDFHDVGCLDSELGRVEAEITDIQPEDDWQVMCSTVPSTIEDVYYPNPSKCEARLLDRKVAIWDIHDPKCEVLN